MANDFTNNLRAVLDQAREIGGRLGLRQWQVSFVKQVWTGQGPGSDNADGSSSSLVSQTITPIKVGANDTDPPVRKLSQREVLASSGLYQEKDIIVKFAKPYATSQRVRTFDVSEFDPKPTEPNTSLQIFFLVTGPESTSPQIYKKVAQNVDKNLGYEITLRNTGRQFV